MPFSNNKIIYLPNGVFNTPVVQRGKKRKYSESFDPKSFDDARYGHHISDDYFIQNMGHNVKR